MNSILNQLVRRTGRQFKHLMAASGTPENQKNIARLNPELGEIRYGLHEQFHLSGKVSADLGGIALNHVCHKSRNTPLSKPKGQQSRFGI